MAYFFHKISETLNNFFLNLYIIKMLGRSIKIMCKNYRFLCELFERIIYLKFVIFFVSIGFQDFVIHD